VSKKTPSYNEFHVGNGKTKKIYSLHCPFPVQIGIKQNGMMLTRIEPFRYSDKKKIIDKAKKKGHEIEVLPVTFSAPDTCPKCKSKGLPSFQQKSYLGSQVSKDERQNKIPADRVWWLRYYHKDQKKTCWIHKYVGNLSNFQNQENTNFESSLLSQAIKIIKEEYLENILKNIDKSR